MRAEDLRYRWKYSIQMLSRETGYSECYIRRVFKEIHGISPKEFERFIRFQAFLGEITKSPEQAGSEETALNCGYYDQSHMLKDFRLLQGPHRRNIKSIWRRRTEVRT
ncbi:MAG: helix-turn-helix domain-containing protein [Ruminococcus sp.]